MTINVDPAEIAKFSELAHRWWDPASDFKPLHDINPLRLDFIDRAAALAGKTVLDVGCGGGILAESMAQRGARVTGIDLSDQALKVAQLHTLESGVALDYERASAEDFADIKPGHFDVVTCMELLEHVPDPASTIRACATLAKPGGHLFFSTINRNLKSYLFAVIGAEYVLRLLPRGTHRYEKFVKPSELAACCRQSGLDVRNVIGMTYNPLTGRYALGADTAVNYLMHCSA
ncbi:MAG: bifunctional 3-demethylubiquinone 3-O-methyltransferase/2-octaprenyl-6-hydroxy phenol methylase [Betaproteobacteria bacterium]|nr:bifunctional 3-demethylubiquinone 3-O-methyltransferase/2-octaprenyl-6-hydroxy phenol methylase [Betaproteobacteria bacterium]